MAAKFYALLTLRGQAKLAQAAALGTQLKITHMGVGDGGGVLPTPDATQTRLVREVRRAAVNSLIIDPVNASQIIAEQVIPEDEGGWWIREIGLYDDAGELIAVANCAETYKPKLAEGSGRTQVIRMILIVSSTDAVTIKIDPSVILATRQYVDNAAIEVRAYADGLMAKHLAAADPHSQYAPKKDPVLSGTPKAPTPAAGDSTTQIATTAFVMAALAKLVDSSPAALDTLNELAAALGDDPNFAATMTNALAGKQPLDNTLSSLSGKSVTALRDFLQLGTAALKNTGTGSGQIPDMSAFEGGANYFRLPGGRIVQFGIIGFNVGNYRTKVSFPIAFPASCDNIQLSWMDASVDLSGEKTNVDFGVVADDLSRKTGFSVWMSGSGGFNLYWMAIGR
ncbi:phage tail protein [Pantoea ananatis]|uniref:phage tail protein n=1 Tax=Pantoea ananas TaxID=553 RepID=UPI00352B03A3